MLRVNIVHFGSDTYLPRVYTFLDFYVTPRAVYYVTLILSYCHSIETFVCGVIYIPSIIPSRADYRRTGIYGHDTMFMGV